VTLTLHAFVCPVCLRRYEQPADRDLSWPWRVRAGSRCGDLSDHQARPCVGRLMPIDDYRRAEWRQSEAEP
jgi:hypothetical protein